jgi:predicted membrane channel-forming protein YqfA (hemolysin III family)
MNKLTKTFLSLLLILAVMAYTVCNFTAGKTDQFSFLVYLVILGIPFINMLNILIQELKNR